VPIAIEIVPGADELLIRGVKPEWQRKSCNGVEWQRVKLIVGLLTRSCVPQRVRVIIYGFDFEDLVEEIAINNYLRINRRGSDNEQAESEGNPFHRFTFLL
jgi:hypothetical protein